MTADLATTYLGMELRNPLVASSSPMTDGVDRLLELEAAGIAAVVLPTASRASVRWRTSGSQPAISASPPALSATGP